MSRRPSDAKLESDFQALVIKRFHRTWDRAMVLKNDTGYMQGVPDLSFWVPGLAGVLEVKPYEGAPYEPNQEYYLNLYLRMGFFSATIFPENEEVVFRAIVRQASRTHR